MSIFLWLLFVLQNMVTFFMFLQDMKLVYKHFATLYFVVVFDSSENELAMLDLIQGEVQTPHFP